jgi:cell division protein FtsW (lipid II flippase)
MPASLHVDQIQARLLRLAIVFLSLFALALTLAPTVRLRLETISVNQEQLPWQHWTGLLVWTIVFAILHRQTMHSLPDRDPFLLPVTALLSGWGLLSQFRLEDEFGWRQTAWIVVTGLLLTLALRRLPNLSFLRRYKYVWLTGGLLLTGLTFLFGTNPLGYGPRLWLGCCGIYLQPSEPLKLLLIIYLAAYLADRQLFLRTLATIPVKVRLQPSLLPVLAPSLLMTGLALSIMLVQRDLGTASILLFLYACIVFLSMNNFRVLISSLVALGVSGIAGYILFDVVRLRVDAWLNPWADPAGRSYQIVQSLLAVANGGWLGRGPGLGSPGLVPISHSDFIFSSIIEETGLLGGIALLALVALLTQRGMRAALHAPDLFQRLLAGGVTAYLCGQTILIIGGNLRLLPLTGVTLPFVSYGGSSLVTSFTALLILLFISNPGEDSVKIQYATRPFRYLNAFLLLGLAAAALVLGYWTAVRGPDLLIRTDNPRRSISDRYVQRGGIYDRNGEPLTVTEGQPGTYAREVVYTDLAPVIGYTHPVYGQSGLEASLDNWLRGLEGYPITTLFWDYLRYGTPPAGLDLRLTIDLNLQRRADELLGENIGAVVLMDAQYGDLLTLASHPTFDPNRLDEQWGTLIDDATAPFLNRVSLGQYPPGASLVPILVAAAYDRNISIDMSLLSGQETDCVNLPDEAGVLNPLGSGCSSFAAALGESLGTTNLLEIFRESGFYNQPQVYLPALISSEPMEVSLPSSTALDLEPDLLVSPLQMALAAASLSNGGVRPAPKLLLAVNTPDQGWMAVSSISEPHPVFTSLAAQAAAQDLSSSDLPIWQSFALGFSPLQAADNQITWYLGGTLPSWQGRPLVVVVLVEKDDPALANNIGLSMLRAATGLTP